MGDVREMWWRGFSCAAVVVAVAVAAAGPGRVLNMHAWNTRPVALPESAWRTAAPLAAGSGPAGAGTAGGSPVSETWCAAARVPVPQPAYVLVFTVLRGRGRRTVAVVTWRSSAGWLAAAPYPGAGDPGISPARPWIEGLRFRVAHTALKLVYGQRPAAGPATGGAFLPVRHAPTPLRVDWKRDRIVGSVAAGACFVAVWQS